MYQRHNLIKETIPMMTLLQGRYMSVTALMTTVYSTISWFTLLTSRWQHCAFVVCLLPEEEESETETSGSGMDVNFPIFGLWSGKCGEAAI